MIKMHVKVIRKIIAEELQRALHEDHELAGSEAVASNLETVMRDCGSMSARIVHALDDVAHALHDAGAHDEAASVEELLDNAGAAIASIKSSMQSALDTIRGTHIDPDYRKQRLSTHADEPEL